MEAPGWVTVFAIIEPALGTQPVRGEGRSPTFSNFFTRNAFRPNMRTPGTGKDFAMQLPERPNLRHLRDQAKDLVRAGAAPTLAAAQFQLARDYGFPSWSGLKQHVESLEQAGELRQAINKNDLVRAQALLASNPGLRQVVIDDVPLQAVAQPGRIPIMELLVRHGADVNGLRWGWFPVLFTPCENLEPEPLQWLLDHGADPNRGNPRDPGTALDYVIQTYPRDPKRLATCIEILLAAGARTRYDVPGVLPLLRSRNDELAALLDANPSLIHRRYPEIDSCGSSGGRLLTLRGATLLHIAAEYGFLDGARLLLDRGAEVNARADVDANGVGGQTPIFHALTNHDARNSKVGQLLIDRGADLSICARVPGHYERPGEILDVSAVEYGALFPLR
jgi:ankyrin repeat protein